MSIDKQLMIELILEIGLADILNTIEILTLRIKELEDKQLKSQENECLHHHNIEIGRIYDNMRLYACVDCLHMFKKFAY